MFYFESLSECLLNFSQNVLAVMIRFEYDMQEVVIARYRKNEYKIFGIISS